MTHEEFAHLCLRIKDGDVSVEIPCCANCYSYHKRGKEWVCKHPKIYGNCNLMELKTNPEDFCSCYLEREE